MPWLTALAAQAQIREDVIPVEVIVLGGAMLVVITVVHGTGLDRIVDIYKRWADKMRGRRPHPRLAIFVFAGAILLMLFLHLLEIFLWGFVLRRMGLVSNIRDAVYFSANTYTTLGMGPMDLPHSWRELSPIIAISGLFTFAWTTSEMFNIVGYHHDLVAELLTKRHQRISARHSEHNPQPKRDSDEAKAPVTSTDK